MCCGQKASGLQVPNQLQVKALPEPSGSVTALFYTGENKVEDVKSVPTGASYKVTKNSLVVVYNQDLETLTDRRDDDGNLLFLDKDQYDMFYAGVSLADISGNAVDTVAETAVEEEAKTEEKSVEQMFDTASTEVVEEVTIDSLMEHTRAELVVMAKEAGTTTKGRKSKIAKGILGEGTND